MFVENKQQHPIFLKFSPCFRPYTAFPDYRSKTEYISSNTVCTSHTKYILVMIVGKEKTGNAEWE